MYDFAELPNPLKVEVDGYVITIAYEVTYAYWISNYPSNTAFMLSGSNDTDIYLDEECQFTGETRLTSPENTSGHPAGLNNFIVFWSTYEQRLICYKDDAA
jgi:hypothetical protein